VSFFFFFLFGFIFLVVFFLCGDRLFFSLGISLPLRDSGVPAIQGHRSIHCHTHPLSRRR